METGLVPCLIAVFIFGSRAMGVNVQDIPAAHLPVCPCQKAQALNPPVSNRIDLRDD